MLLEFIPRGIQWSISSWHYPVLSLNFQSWTIQSHLWHPTIWKILTYADTSAVQTAFVINISTASTTNTKITDTCNFNKDVGMVNEIFFTFFGQCNSALSQNFLLCIKPSSTVFTDLPNPFLHTQDGFSYAFLHNTIDLATNTAQVRLMIC